VSASLKLSAETPKRLPAGLKQRKVRSGKGEIRTLTNLHAENRIASEVTTLAGLEREQMPEYLTVREQYFMVVMQGDAAGTQSWQVHVVEISVTRQKPQKQIPRKI